MNLRKLFLSAVFVLAAATARATSNYEYGANEYVTISEGLSPDGRLAITAHGGGDLGYDHFRLYLFDAVTGKKIGPLEEITEVLDTGAESFGARWNKDGSEATIIYRVDRHAPFKTMTYRFAGGRAIPATRQPVDAKGDAAGDFWQAHCATAVQSGGRKFGTPKAHL